MCTAGYHHGSRYDWICQIGRSRNWPEIVDSTSDYHSEAQTKNWAEALKRLKEIITKKQQSVT